MSVTGKNENKLKTLKRFQICLAINGASFWALVLLRFIVASKLYWKIDSSLPLQNPPGCVVSVNLKRAGVHSKQTGVCGNIYLVSLVLSVCLCCLPLEFLCPREAKAVSHTGLFAAQVQNWRLQTAGARRVPELYLVYLTCSRSSSCCLRMLLWLFSC